VTGAERGTPGALPLTKAAPYFQPLDIHVADLGTEAAQLGAEAVTITRQIFDDDVHVTEVRWVLDDVLADDGPARRSMVRAALRALAGDEGTPSGLFEEYVAICLPPVPSPDTFVADNNARLAALLREEARDISREEASHILASRVRYSDADLAIVDWDGALLVDRPEQVESDLALLKLGNNQLLQYRLLDQRVDQQLQQLRSSLAQRRVTVQRRALRAVLQTRLDLVLDYAGVEQSLLLIGDWYTAELYRVILDEFYINEWKSAVDAKLDDLHSVADSASANLAISWQQLLDLAQIIGWTVLLLGYFVLFSLELSRS
jgi:hypothetical protein